MDSKIIQLHLTPGQTRNEYLRELRRLSGQLQNLAVKYGETPRAVISDLTYIVVGDDIIAACKTLKEEKL